jgi:hypothetical protein
MGTELMKFEITGLSILSKFENKSNCGTFTGKSDILFSIIVRPL